MIKEAIAAIAEERRDLSEGEAAEVMHEIMRAGRERTDEDEVRATEAQFGAFVTALAMKGETVDEITGMARIMRAYALHVDVPDRPLLDTCGTGGSRLKKFNASTAAAFVAAAAGAKVAKHGNRAATSQSGSADLLEALGATVALAPDQVAECIARTGVGFMFAPAMHPAMKFAGPLRPQLGIRTVFNILGPLTNPANANCHVLGVPNRELAEKLAHVMARLGMRHALVVSGSDGLDDITVTGPTHVFEIKANGVTPWELTPGQMGLDTHPFEDIVGGTPQENAKLLRQIFNAEGPRAVRDLVAANAGAALYVTGLASSIRQGVEMSLEVIRSGDAAARLGAFVEATRRVGAAKSAR